MCRTIHGRWFAVLLEGAVIIMNRMHFISLKRIHHRLDQHLAVDLRSLAVFRMCLGLLLMVDFSLRMLQASSLYSAEGVLPLETLRHLPQQSWPWFWSVCAISDRVEWIRACCGVGVVASFLLAAGWRARWMSFVALIFLHSIQARNPWTNYGGDKLLFLLLLWSCFLPMGARFAYGKKCDEGNGPDSMSLSSCAGWGLRLQVCVMYLFSVLRKHGDAWLDGSALHDALEIDQFALPAAVWLKSLPDSMLRYLTWLTLLVEGVAPLLLLARGTLLRLIGMGLLLVLQFSFWLTLDIGLFPFISTLALLPHVPGHVWTWFGFGRGPVLLKRGTFSTAVKERLVAWMLVFMLVWNVWMTWDYPDTLKSRMPNWAAQVVSLLRMDQYWGMFSPNPMVHDGWYVMLAEREDGSRFDLLDPERSSLWEKPEDVLKTFPSDRWKEYMMMLYDLSGQSGLWERVVDHFKSTWQEKHPGDPPIHNVEVYYMMEKTLPKGVAPVEKELLWPEPSGL
jgi:hypothetical protein